MRLKFILTLAVVCGASFTQISNAQNTAKITSSGIGYLEYLPQDYSNNSNDYPVVIFLHGIGEKGTTSTDPATIKSSVQKVANVGLPKYIKYGAQYPFIVISPQLKSNYGTWPANYIMDVVNHVKKDLRINEKRIYITGLSLGGFGTWTVLGAYPEVFAAALPICSGGNALSKACTIAAENIPIWGFHATDDKVVSYTVTTKMINAVNACTPKPSPLAKTTLFNTGGHIIWDKVYKQTDAINWMLSFTNGSTSSGTTTNNPPTVSAGSDKSITLPTNEVYIQGTASDSDGSIASYSWSKVSGGASSLSENSTSKVRAYNLAEGTYTFRLTVKDNEGASKYDDVKVIVGSSSSSSTSNVAPIANAGSDRTTTYTAITIVGSGTDKDGSIASYQWTQTGGAASRLKDANTSKLVVSELKDGKYYYRLTVKDNNGAADSDDIIITVSNSGSTATTTTSTSNIAPVSNAGPDKRIDIVDVLKLYGKGYDKDGSIVSYKWTQFGGPDLDLNNVNSPTLQVSGLEEGTRYYLKLTVKDNDGAVAHDKMYILINES